MLQSQKRYCVHLPSATAAAAVASGSWFPSSKTSSSNLWRRTFTPTLGNLLMLSTFVCTSSVAPKVNNFLFPSFWVDVSVKSTQIYNSLFLWEPLVKLTSENWAVQKIGTIPTNREKIRPLIIYLWWVSMDLCCFKISIDISSLRDKWRNSCDMPSLHSSFQ